MEKKYELIEQNEVKVEKSDGRIIKPYRIKALIDIDNEYRPVHAGDLGGFVEGRDNLDQFGTGWIFDEAMALDDASVWENATLMNHARATKRAIVKGKAVLFDNALISDDAIIAGSARMSENALAINHALIADEATISGQAVVRECAAVIDQVHLGGKFEARGTMRFIGEDWCE